MRDGDERRTDRRATRDAGLAVLLLCGWAAAAQAAPPQAAPSGGTDGAVVFEPDPAQGSVAIEPSGAMPPVVAAPTPPAAAPPAQPTAASPAAPEAASSAPSQASTVIPPAGRPGAIPPPPAPVAPVAPEPRTAAPEPRTAASAPAAAGLAAFAAHRQGRLWRIAPRAGGDALLATVDLHRVSLAPDLAARVMAGRATLLLDGWLLRGRHGRRILVASTIDGGIDDPPHGRPHAAPRRSGARP